MSPHPGLPFFFNNIIISGHSANVLKERAGPLNRKGRERACAAAAHVNFSLRRGCLVSTLQCAGYLQNNHKQARNKTAGPTKQQRTGEYESFHFYCRQDDRSYGGKKVSSMFIFFHYRSAKIERWNVSSIDRNSAQNEPSNRAYD